MLLDDGPDLVWQQQVTGSPGGLLPDLVAAVRDSVGPSVPPCGPPHPAADARGLVGPTVPAVPMSPYLERMRAAVGHDLLLLPSAAVLPLRADGAVLLMRHHASGRWETIGGMVEPGEDPADAARREVAEEVGVEVSLGRLLGVVGGPDFEVTYPNGDRCAYVSSVWEATIVAGEPVADGDEALDLRWFGRDELAAADLGPFCRASLAAVGWLDGMA